MKTPLTLEDKDENETQWWNAKAGGGAAPRRTNPKIDDDYEYDDAYIAPLLTDPRPKPRPIPEKPIPNNQDAIRTTGLGNVNGRHSDTDGNTTKNGCPISMNSGEEMLPLEDAALPGPSNLRTHYFFDSHRGRDQYPLYHGR